MIARGVLLLLGLGLARRPRENLFRIIAVALFGYMMLKHERFLGLFALVAPMLAAEPLARSFPHIAAPPGREREAVPRLTSAVLLAAALGAGLLRSPEPSPLTTPAAALAVARELGLAGRVYNDYDFGGFLIAEGVRTFIDGRTDQLFLGGFIGGLHEAVQAPDNKAFAALLAGHGVTWAFVKLGSPEARHLNGLPGWRLVHEDATAALFARARS